MTKNKNKNNTKQTKTKTKNKNKKTNNNNNKNNPNKKKIEAWKQQNWVEARFEPVTLQVPCGPVTFQAHRLKSCHTPSLLQLHSY